MSSNSNGKQPASSPHRPTKKTKTSPKPSPTPDTEESVDYKFFSDAQLDHMPDDERLQELFTVLKDLVEHEARITSKTRRIEWRSVIQRNMEMDMEKVVHIRDNGKIIKDMERVL